MSDGQQESTSSAAQTVTQSILTRERERARGCLVSDFAAAAALCCFAISALLLPFAHLALLLCPLVSVLDKFAQRAVHLGR